MMATEVHTASPSTLGHRSAQAGYVLIRLVGFALIWLGMLLFTATGVAVAIARWL